MNTPIDPNFMQNIAWEVNPPQDERDGIPYATHSGVLELFGKSMKCHRLSNGQTVFEADDMAAFFEGFFTES